MNYWLLKSEPSTWSWEQQCQVQSEPWNGVRNYQAQNNMKAMAVGDRAFFYHSVKEKQIVGIVEICKAFYPDPTDTRWGLVDIKAITPLPQPITLETIKKDPSLQHLALVRQSRLSVMPIDAASWKHLCHLGGLSS